MLISNTIKGAGCSKGGPFMASFNDFRDPARMPAKYFSDIAIENIEELAAANEIDPISNLPDRAVYIISGSKDPTVPPHN